MPNQLLNTLKSINHDKIIYYISFVFCLGIVFQGQSKIPLTFGIVFTSFFWLIKPNYKEKWQALKANKAHLLLVLFYLFMGLSIFWSDDLKTFGRLIQLKLSLLLSSLVWSSTYLTKQQVKTMLLWFMSLVALHLSLDLILLSLNGNDINVHEFSLISKNRKHYIALFTLFSFGIANHYLLQVKLKWSKLLLIGVSLFFAYNLLVIGSRIHMVGFLALSVYFIWKLIQSNFSKTLIRGTVLGLLLTVTSVCLFSERIQFKIKETQDEIHRIFDKTYIKNTNPRVYIWPSAIKAMGDNLLFGHGLGDAQHALNSYTDKIDIEFWLNGANTKLKDKNINSHSQYFEIVLQVGLFGFLIFLGVLFFSFKRRNQIFVVFSICILLSMITESIFERQFGLVFFAFFYPFLLEKHPLKSNS